MTTLTNEPLLPLTVYGTPSGNYNGSSPDFIGNAVIASSYYGHRGTGLQTVVLQVTDFVGVINLQATLNDWTEQAMWFDVDTYGNGANTTTATTAINLPGNFVWIRAKVTEFTSGTINSATVIF